MVLYLYVLSYLMAIRFLSICSCSANTTVIANCTEGTMSISIRKLLNHSASIAAFYYCYGSGLHGGVSNARLLLTPPSDGFTPKGERIA